MRKLDRTKLTATTAFAALLICLSGCTSFHDYITNGFKVGPNYCPPTSPVAEQWIDQAELHTAPNPAILCRWWTVFNDPKLNYLIECAYRQNISLKEAYFRVVQARALKAIAVGTIFPQTQNAFGSYSRLGDGGAGFTDLWDTGFRLQWELDVWGRLRRAVAAADARLDASVEGYDSVLVTLLGDVAQAYVDIRTDQERIRLLQFNVDNVQMDILRRTRARAAFDPETGEVRPGLSVVTMADAYAAESTLRQTNAAINQLRIAQRQAENRLCILLGMPPVDLTNILSDGPIPVCPPDVILGIPADLVRRRPDVRRAERLAAAQAEQIGIAESDLYPIFRLSGTMAYTAQNFPELFEPTAFNGSVGPSFQWNLLNYGRILNNVRYQDAIFQELCYAYQSTVLLAGREVEDGLVTFLQQQRRAKQLDEAYNAQSKALDIAKLRYMQGMGEASFTTYTVYEQNLLSTQDASAQARGQISQGLIAVYRALGGGWELRLGGEGAAGPMPERLPQVPAEAVPAPQQIPQPPPPAQ
jgi:NodT family efflux transporter outer membrane factor (OMF) lipoprotein